jgi:hypothetical protein
LVLGQPVPLSRRDCLKMQVGPWYWSKPGRIIRVLTGYRMIFVIRAALGGLRINGDIKPKPLLDV